MLRIQLLRTRLADRGFHRILRMVLCKLKLHLSPLDSSGESSFFSAKTLLFVAF